MMFITIILAAGSNRTRLTQLMWFLMVSMLTSCRYFQKSQSLIVILRKYCYIGTHSLARFHVASRTKITNLLQLDSKLITYLNKPAIWNWSIQKFSEFLTPRIMHRTKTKCIEISKRLYVNRTRLSTCKSNSTHVAHDLTFLNTSMQKTEQTAK
jgi:hypothetical protein